MGSYVELLVAELKLCDFLTFSSTILPVEIGDVTYPTYRPAPYIHNYPLMYAFSGLTHASLTSPSKPGNPSEVSYLLLDEIERNLYVYPASPVLIDMTRLIGNVKSEGFAEPRKVRPKSLYPWHVAHMAFAPGSAFETVILVTNENVKLPGTIRLGVKRQGVFEVRYYHAKVKGFVSGWSDPVNLGDVIRYGLEPEQYYTLLTTKTVHKSRQFSNMIVRGYYSESKLSVIEVSSGQYRRTFRLPLPKL